MPTYGGFLRYADKQKEQHMKLQVCEGDLLDQDVEVIVNAWNRNIIPWWLLLPQGVEGEIRFVKFREPD